MSLAKRNVGPPTLDNQIVPYNSNIYPISMRARVISITIRDELVKQIDEKRKDVPRSKWIVRTLESKLQVKE